jgi:DNA-binding SARP family transcriptional activator
MLDHPTTGSNDETSLSLPQKESHAWSLLICLFGPFRLLNPRQIQLEHGGEKTEALLTHLALHHNKDVPREQLLVLLWPESDTSLAGQSLNTLVYSMRKALRGELRGVAPIVQINGHYRLNYEAGLTTDIVQFERFTQEGDYLTQIGQPELATAAYCRAIEFYRGDLSVGTNLQSVIQREHMRARYLGLLMKIADHYYSTQDFSTSLAYAQRLLLHDPCREDAHRMVMRCSVRMGERAQAFRQYLLCRSVLQSEFEAEPESATVALFDQIRLAPDNV